MTGWLAMLEKLFSYYVNTIESDLTFKFQMSILNNLKISNYVIQIFLKEWKQKENKILPVNALPNEIMFEIASHLMMFYPAQKTKLDLKAYSHTLLDTLFDAQCWHWSSYFRLNLLLFKAGRHANAGWLAKGVPRICLFLIGGPITQSLNSLFMMFIGIE